MQTRRFRKLIVLFFGMLGVFYVQLSSLAEFLVPTKGGGVSLMLAFTQLPGSLGTIPLSPMILKAQGVLLAKSLFFLAIAYYPAQWVIKISSLFFGIFDPNSYPDVVFPENLFALAVLTWEDGTRRDPGETLVGGLPGWDNFQLSLDRQTAQLQYLSKNHPDKVIGSSIPIDRINRS